MILPRRVGCGHGRSSRSAGSRFQDGRTSLVAKSLKPLWRAEVGRDEGSANVHTICPPPCYNGALGEQNRKSSQHSPACWKFSAPTDKPVAEDEGCLSSWSLFLV